MEKGKRERVSLRESESLQERRRREKERLSGVIG